MMRRVQLGLAAIGAFALFALALWAGGETKLVVARDTSSADLGRLMSQIATPFAATRSDASANLAQAKARDGETAKTPAARGATSNRAKSTPGSRSPGGTTVDGVRRGSHRGGPGRNEDVTRGSHADGGA